MMLHLTGTGRVVGIQVRIGVRDRVRVRVSVRVTYWRVLSPFWLSERTGVAGDVTLTHVRHLGCHLFVSGLGWG